MLGWSVHIAEFSPVRHHQKSSWSRNPHSSLFNYRIWLHLIGGTVFYPSLINITQQQYTGCSLTVPPLKITKWQTLRRFWHFFDGIYYVIWHLDIFREGTVKKNTLYEATLKKTYGKHVFTGHYVQLLKYQSMKFEEKKCESPTDSIKRSAKIEILVHKILTLCQRWEISGSYEIALVAQNQSITNNKQRCLHKCTQPK